MHKLPSKRPQPAAEKLLHALLRTWNLVRQTQEPYFARFGISGSQWGILRVLQRAELNGEPELPLKEVGERLLVQAPSVTGIVDRLERMGLVQRSACDADMRVRNLRLTPQGRELLAKVLERHSERVERLFAPLQADEREMLLAMVQRLETHLEGLNRVPADSVESRAVNGHGGKRQARKPARRGAD
jgi:DNA-binding MarR family transcriptional regulator